MKINDFWLRRLHSLTGVVPVGVFLLEHMFTNSKALQGKEAYNGAVEWILNLPYVHVMEILFIGVPILFHAALGVVIALRSKQNVTRYGYFRNWMYFFQRITGLFLVVYIAWHVWETRIYAIKDPLVKLNFYDFMAAKFQNLGYVLFQLAGVFAAAFHFANGLWTFLIVWGVIVGTKSQKWVSAACYALGAAIFVMGIDSLRGFGAF
jgi:succinate dehydrogenase / fumarate reductase cytochrome b subunit